MDDLWAYFYKSLVKDGGGVAGQSLYIPVYLVPKKAVLFRWEEEDMCVWDCGTGRRIICTVMKDRREQWLRATSGLSS